MARRGNPKWQKGVSGNPTGKRGKRRDAERDDGWVNLLTGLGIGTKDKRLSAGFIAEVVDDATAREYWLGNDIAARIIETLPQEMLRAGWELQIKTDDEDTASESLDISENLTSVFEELGTEMALERALQYERAYGGAAIFPIINNGNDDLEMPLDMEGIIGLSHFVVLEPREMHPETWQSDLTLPGFGEPETYRISPVTRGLAKFPEVIIHESRLIIFPGIRVSRLQTSAPHTSWGGSVLTRVNGVLRDFGVAWESVAAILQDFAQGVYKIEGLAQILAQDDKKTFVNRMQAMDLAKSVLRAIVLDINEDYERQQTPISGIPETLDKFATRLAAAADMPVTLLMGTSPAGLNATGESDRAFFYDRVARMQQIKLKPRMEKLIQMMFNASTLGPNKDLKLEKRLEPDVWSIQFHPLWEPSAKERAETRYQVAQSDGIYLDRGVLLPEEVALSRFGGDEYSDNTQIETETREKVLELGLKQMHEEALNPPDPAAQNGPANGQNPTQAKQGGQAGTDSQNPPAGT